MRRERLPLTSEQLELLLAFERAGSLQGLAEAMARDVSVVSRSLQRLAETLPVLEKAARRWRITPLGLAVNEATRAFLRDLTGRLAGHAGAAEGAGPPLASRLAGAALVVVNAQAGLFAAAAGPRGGAEAAVRGAARVLGRWRQRAAPVVHVRHVSDAPGSPFQAGAAGAAFLPELSPVPGEPVLDKTKASAFAGTALLETLAGAGVATIVLAGFTANECIDATARQASDLGFSVLVVGDATASFAVHGADGRLYEAERVHALTLANLHALFATVLTADEILNALS